MLRLHPAPAVSRPLVGAYLELDPPLAPAADGILIFSNYIASLDGRISLADHAGQQQVPESIGNARDWRLYQELAAQSDVLIVSGRYFRQFSAGCAQAPLPLDAGGYPDLVEWRRARGMSAQPAVAVVSASLDLPADALAAVADRRCLVLTAADADGARLRRLATAGIEVWQSPSPGEVGGGWMRARLRDAGFRIACMIAGPAVHRTLLAAGALDEIFLTVRHVLAGGADFRCIVQGDLPGPVPLALVQAWLDEGDAVGQHFTRWRVDRPA
ncbi:MAG: dihydrofolate reductase family protein [Mariprofundaceae bacterium]